MTQKIVYIIYGAIKCIILLKRNQNDGIIIFTKQHLVIDLYEYNFCEANIIKLRINNYVVPICLL